MSTPSDPFRPPADQPPEGAPWSAPQGQPTGPPQGQPPPGGQPWQAQPWGSAPHGGGPAGPARNGLGVAALVLGILALLTSFTVVGGVLLGLAAVILGVLGRGRAKRGEADNGGTATAGIVLGVIAVLLAAAALAFGVAFFQSDTGRSLVECLEEAGQDPAAQQQCQQDAIDGLEQQ